MQSDFSGGHKGKDISGYGNSECKHLASWETMMNFEGSASPDLV